MLEAEAQQQLTRLVQRGLMETSGKHREAGILMDSVDPDSVAITGVERQLGAPGEFLAVTVRWSVSPVQRARP